MNITTATIVAALTTDILDALPIHWVVNADARTVRREVGELLTSPDMADLLLGGNAYDHPAGDLLITLSLLGDPRAGKYKDQLLVALGQVVRAQSRAVDVLRREVLRQALDAAS